ncbi:MAG: branched-chain amino acid ABC transporter substrate-binding protein [Rhodospirillales bacterium]|nr:branched-chain amino acid ABC transporter substrate-binding protein [Rhodospirillales bacterium]
MKQIISGILVAVAAVVVVIIAMDRFGGDDGDSGQPIEVATVGPLTGQYASFGQQLEQGGAAAVADLNAQGGVLGRQLVFSAEDDACDPKQAVAVANSLASKEVPIVIGHFCSGSSIPASNVYAEEGIVQISPASTNPQFTERGLDNVFRTCGRDDAQGLIAGVYLAESHGSDRIAIVHDKTAYGKGLADETRAALNAQGVTEVLYEAYTAGEKDYSTLVSKLKLEQIDVLYVGGYHSEAGLIVRQMRDQGLDTQLISGDALVSQEYWAITGEAGEGTRMTFSPDPRNNPEAADVVKRFREELNYEPEGYTLYTYAAIQAWAQAAESAGSLEPDAIKAALKGGTFETVLGTLSFDEKGDIEGPSYVFYEWSNGDYHEVN